MQLRDYQQEIFHKTKLSFATGHKAPLIVAPCGSGKTVIFSYFTRKAIENGNRVLLLAHRDELIDQISNTLKYFCVKHSFLAAGRWYDPNDKVHVGSVMTVANRLDRITPPTFIINDECHHCVSNNVWGKILAHFPKAFRIGVTATPVRLSGEPLDMFDDLILGPSMRSLIDRGFLSDFKIYGPDSVDISSVGMRGGDFITSDMKGVVDKPSITGCAIANYEKYANKKRAIVYCFSIDHAEKVAEQFRASGHSAFSIDGKMSPEIRRNLMRDFRNGEFDLLTTCDLVSEGVDIPAVVCGIMLRPTQSISLWKQQTGRILRPMEGKDMAIIIDHVGNTIRLQMWPDDELEWTLAGREKQKRPVKSEDKLSVRVCPSCFAAQKSGKGKCVFCGYDFPVEERKIEVKEGELVELQRQQESKKRRMEQGMCKTIEELKAFGKAHGYAPGWAYMIYNSRKKNQRPTANA